MARDYGATTALITGKGEPTLWAEDLIYVARILGEYFPLVEVQTNGMKLSDYITHHLYEAGVTTIAVSCVHYRQDINQECYGSKYRFLGDTVNAIHLKNMAVRLTCMCVKGWIDSPDEVDRMIHQAHTLGVEQLTLRSIKVGSVTWRAPKIHKWTGEHIVDMIDIQKFIEDGRSVRLESLVHGNVYAYQLAKGEQNVCLSDCLTRNPKGNTIRQLIYCPDGHVRYDWEHDAAIVF